MRQLKCIIKNISPFNNLDEMATPNEKILTSENKKKVKSGLKIARIVLGVIVAIDIISMLIYFIFFGVPH